MGLEYSEEAPGLATLMPRRQRLNSIAVVRFPHLSEAHPAPALPAACLYDLFPLVFLFLTSPVLSPLPCTFSEREEMWGRGTQFCFMSWWYSQLAAP